MWHDGAEHEQRQGDERVVFEAGGDDEQEVGRRCVDALEESAAEQPMIDDRRARLHADLGRGVDAAGPAGRAETVEVLRMPPFQDGLGLAVARLLLEVGADRVAPVVPDEASRAEADPVAALLEPPADVHVVAGLPEDRVEAADLLQRPSVERHVAARDVLREAVGEHHVGGAAR